MTDAMNSRAILEVLAEAGTKGLHTRDIALAFNPEGGLHRAMSDANSYLGRAYVAGRVRRSGTKELTMSPAGRRSRSRRWFITSAGIGYLDPKPEPEITQLPEAPNTRRVLELLNEAGDEGILASVLARYFTVPDPTTPSMAKLKTSSKNLQRRMSWANQILDRFLRHGWVRRGDAEPSPYYHNVPVYRWYVTSEGVAYLAAGMAAGLHAAKIAQARRKAQQDNAKRKRVSDLITQAYADFDPHAIYKCEREKVIRELREAGCTLDEIGGVFDLTRERIRQILIGYKEGPCKCPRCTDAEWFEVGDGATAGD